MTRHCDRLFPADLTTAGEARDEATLLRKNFRVLGRKNERKRLASHLELKMRAIYYDVIDPAAVEGYIASIYQQVKKKVGLSTGHEPAGRVRRSSKSHGSDRDRRFSKYHGSGRVGSGHPDSTRNRLDPTRPDSNRPDPTRPVSFYLTRE